MACRCKIDAASKASPAASCLAPNVTFEQSGLQERAWSEYAQLIRGLIMAEFQDPSPGTWLEAESSPGRLQEYLNNLYWEGVTRDIQNAIMSLKQLDDVPGILEENDIMKRIPAEAAFFVEPWAPWKLRSDEWDGIWECVAARMAEHQGHELQYRRARMLLIGLGLLDIKRVIDFRDPPLRSLEGTVQANVVEIPRPSGRPQLLVHAVSCCECGKAIRSSFHSCSEGCIHHDTTGTSRCSFAKHQYNVCAYCYLATDHTKQHLTKVRPYDPMAGNVATNMDEKARSSLAKVIRKLQERINKEEDSTDGSKRLRATIRNAPNWAKKAALPFGNTHAWVMFGPLTFEIGARHSKGGALVMLRPTPDLSYSDTWRFVGSEKTSPAVAVSPDKKVFRCTREVEKRSIHATTTQVLGGLFSGHYPAWSNGEDEVIRLLVAKCSQYREKPTKSLAHNARHLREAAHRIVDALRPFLEKEVSSYLRHFTSVLLSPSTTLKWDQISNNCQIFCQNLVVHPETFKTLFPKTKIKEVQDGSAPKYLLSFASEKFGSLYDSAAYHTTPTATYFAEFHIGEDIVEYFQTWPDIPKPNLCAALLCWPCQTGDKCSIAQHMWMFPHETTSLAQMHIHRDRIVYRTDYETDDPYEDEPALYTDEEWFRNRLLILLGLDSFLGTAGALFACYQVCSEILGEQGEQRGWQPGLVKDVGMLIRQGSPGDGIFNFTIENVSKKNWFTSLLPKNRNMAKHLAENSHSTHLSSN